MSDLISRQAAIDALCSECQGRCIPCENYPCSEVEAINALPSAHTEIEERKEESAQNVPKEDLISRKAAIDAECEVCQIAPKKERGHNCTYYVHGCKEIECLRALPSAQPERKKGKWIDETFKPWGLVYHPYKCDQCGEHSEADSDFCPNCGADMREDGASNADVES